MVRMASFQLADSLFFKTFIKLMSKKKKGKSLFYGLTPQNKYPKRLLFYTVFS